MKLVVLLITALSAVVNGQQSEWRYDQYKDRMGRDGFSAIVPSKDTANFGFPYSGEQHALLALRANRTDITDVMLSIKRGQFICSGYSGCSVNVRFDQGRIQRFQAAGPDDHDTTVLFIRDPEAFMEGLRKAKTVSIEALFYHEGHVAFTFPIEGLQW